MSAEAFIERRTASRLAPVRASAVVAGDSLLVGGSWQSGADADAVRRWDALARRTATPNPFLESWYLLPALRRLAPATGVDILRMERGGVLAGLLPVVRKWRYDRWPLPHLAGWMHPNCFLGAPLVAAGDERAFWRALFAWADAHAGTALFLHLSALPLDGPLVDALFAEAGAQDRQAVIVQREQRALLSSPLSPEAYLEDAVAGKKRKEYRRQRARLAEQGRIAFERRDDDRGLAVWTDHFLALEHQGWKGRAGSALRCADGTELLFRDALRGAAERGLLERLTLSLDGRPIAMLASFMTAPGSFSYKTTFDETYARYSPGVLLQLENLAVLDRAEIAWCDSCATAGHPMIDSLWTGRRPVGRVSIAIGGQARRAAFQKLVGLELARSPLPAAGTALIPD